jgi:hypothetical protein
LYDFPKRQKGDKNVLQNLSAVFESTAYSPALAAPPINDNFSNAETITLLPFSTTVDITDAGIEPGEVTYWCSNIERTVWYTFTPTESMTVRLDMQGSAISGAIGIYSGNASGLNSLVIQDCVFTSSTSVIRRLEAGQTYYLQAGALNGETGSISINFEQVPSPSNDFFTNAEVISSLPFNETLDVTGAWSEPGEPWNCINMDRTVWHSFTPAETMLVQADIQGSAIESNVNIYHANGSDISSLQFLGCNNYAGGIFLAEAGQTYYLQAGGTYGGAGMISINLKQIFPPPNDNLINAKEITSLPFNDTLDVSGAGIEPNEPQQCFNNQNTVWYSFTPLETMSVNVNANLNVSVYSSSGSGIDNLSFQGCNNNNGSLPFLVEAGKKYYLQVNGIGNLQISLNQIYPPPNDNYANAEAITSLPFNATPSITDATIEIGEPQFCGFMSQTIWYSFSPTETMSIRADMLGSAINGFTRIYRATGTGISNLQNILCVSSYSGPSTFLAEVGQTYYLQAGRDYGGIGNIQVNLQRVFPPANDNFINALAIPPLPFSATTDITEAGSEANEPQYCYNSPKTIWYSFTPTANALISADMIGSSFGDTILNVYQDAGSGIGGLSFIQCTSFGNSAKFNAQAGITYYIQAGSIYTNGGDLRVNLQEIPRPSNDDFANAKAISALPFDDVLEMSTATVEASEPTPSCVFYGLGSRSIWYTFTPATSGTISANIPYISFAPVSAVYSGNSMTNLTQMGCAYAGNKLTFQANAGTRYYFQVSNLYPWDQVGTMQFHLDVAPPPVAGMYFYPSDPTIFDNIQFYDQSYDPSGLSIQSYAWDFGDGATSADTYPTHRYLTGGDYTVQHTITTIDGRTASTSQVVHVSNHDVTIIKVESPSSAKLGQAQSITVIVNNATSISETVKIDLYRSVIGGGFEWITSLTLIVPPSKNNHDTQFSFRYTFTTADAQLGKVIFRAVATIEGARDGFPQDNERLSSLTIVKTKK